VRDANENRIADLLHQVSGYRDYYPLDYVNIEMSHPITPNEIVRRYTAFPLTHPPRTQWEYSNTNYLLAGQILQRVSGMPWGEFLRQRIFRPLAMTHTFVDEPMRKGGDRATGYNSYFTEPPHVDSYEAPDWLSSAGALAGTASDVARWDIAFMNGSILGSASTRAMIAPAILMPGSVNTGYGLGLDVYSRRGHRLVGHGGNVIGFSSENLMAFDDRIAVVVLANSYEAPTSMMARDVLDTLIPALRPRSTATPTATSTPMPTLAQRSALHAIASGLAALRSGRLTKTTATSDFLLLMNSLNRRRAMSVLQRLGKTRSIGAVFTFTRGGFNTVAADVAFEHGRRSAVLYETPDGRIAELFLLH
jgi:CubicO group peptidase (beta-lactamase class C family)